MKPLSPVQSAEGSSSTRSVMSRRRDTIKQRSNDAPHHPEATAFSKSIRSSVFRRIGAEARHKEKELKCSSSNLRVLKNNVQIPPLHRAPKENNVTQLQEVNEMLA